MNNQYIWYACYGSNLCYERFMKYINGCCDKTPPREWQPFDIPHELYFAREASTWDNMAVAFIKPEAGSGAHTFGRIYRIKREQYGQVKSQEGAKYTKEIGLGEKEGIEIVTFTDQTEYGKKEPSDRYLDCIAKGLRETYPEKPLCEIEDYLSKHAGKQYTFREN